MMQKRLNREHYGDQSLEGLSNLCPGSLGRDATVACSSRDYR